MWNPGSVVLPQLVWSPSRSLNRTSRASLCILASVLTLLLSFPASGEAASVDLLVSSAGTDSVLR